MNFSPQLEERFAKMLTRYPERFGALFCTVPVIDLRRSAKLRCQLN